MSKNQQSSQPVPLRVVLLSGGRSAEREVSLKTGAAIHAALLRLGHSVIEIDPDLDLVEHLKHAQPDVVYNALHGTEGEDGIIQGLLDWHHIPYTGSGLTSSALAMDKSLSKILLRQADLPLASGLTWSVGDSLPSTSDLPSPPWIVKPTSEGSSVGLHCCDDLDHLHQTLASKSNDGPTTWLIEERVQGVEVSVVVFQGEAWGGVEIAPSSGMYDYEAKYQRKDTQYFCPPRLPEDCLQLLDSYAEQTYQLLGCQGVARVDFIVHPSRVIILEINTLPGMTETSLVPKVAAARGIDFDTLVHLSLQQAIEGLHDKDKR